MPLSKKQLAANRRNALKSTGPRTNSGKAIACKNAVTHGLTAADDIIINSPHLKENPDDYHALVDSLIVELQPNGTLQQHLVIKIVNCLWRYKRIIKAETAKINQQLSQEPPTIDQLLTVLSYLADESEHDGPIPDFDTNPEPPDPASLNQRSIPSDPFLTKLMYYEMRLDRQLTRSYKLLMQLQLIDEAKRLSILQTEQKSAPNEPISVQLDNPQ
jgi:hypothetical protein